MTEMVAPNELQRIVKGLSPGETVTLTDEGGEPLAVVVAVGEPAKHDEEADDWSERWKVLADQISKAWKSDQTALEALAEIRR